MMRSPAGASLRRQSQNLKRKAEARRTALDGTWVHQQKESMSCPFGWVGVAEVEEVEEEEAEVVVEQERKSLHQH